MITRTKRNDIVTVTYYYEGMDRTVTIKQDEEFLKIEPPFFHTSALEEVRQALLMASNYPEQAL